MNDRMGLEREGWDHAGVTHAVDCDMGVDCTCGFDESCSFCPLPLDAEHAYIRGLDGTAAHVECLDQRGMIPRRDASD